jgi:hypothetical protein
MKKSRKRAAAPAEKRAKTNAVCCVCGQGGDDTPVHAVTLPSTRIAPMCESCEGNDFRRAEAERRTDPRCVCTPVKPRLDCPVHVPRAAVAS